MSEKLIVIFLTTLASIVLVLVVTKERESCSASNLQKIELEESAKNFNVGVVSYGKLPLLDRHNVNLRALNDGMNFVFFVPNVNSTSNYECDKDAYIAIGAGYIE